MFTLLWVYREGPMGACVGKGSGDWYLFWGPASPSPPASPLIMPICDKSKWNWSPGPASLASGMCEFWQNSRWADTLCVLWADSPLAQQFENLALTWGTDVKVRSKSYFSSSLACSRRVVTEHLAMMGRDTPPHLPLGDTEMGALVNEAGGWWRCFPEADWCHEERSLGSAKSEWRLHAARYETLVNLVFLPHERQKSIHLPECSGGWEAMQRKPWHTACPQQSMRDDYLALWTLF